MFVEGVPVKSRQKLLRHLRVVDSIVLLLKAPFKCPKGRSGSQRERTSGNHRELTPAGCVGSGHACRVRVHQGLQPERH